MDFKTVHTKYHRMVEMIVLDNVYDPSDHPDALQEAWTAIANSLDQYDADEAAMSTWLWWVALNAVRTYLRNNYERQPDLVCESVLEGWCEEEGEMMGWLDTHAIETDTPERCVQAEQLAAVFDTLTDQQRAVIVGVTNGKTYDELAVELDTSEANIRKIVERTKRALGH